MAAPSSTSTSNAAVAEPQAADSLWIRLCKGINAATELPGLYEVTWVVFYCTNLIFGPLWAAQLFLWWVIEGLTGKWWPHYHKPEPGQAVLITGCDTGFGHETALRLASAGWTVYAGCLTEAGMAALAAKGPGSKLVPVKMDVTKAEDVARVVQRLVDDKVSLYALVNNAVRLSRDGWGFEGFGR